MRKISRRLNFCLLPKFDLKNLKNKISLSKFSFVYGNIWNIFNLDLAVLQKGFIKPPIPQGMVNAKQWIFGDHFGKFVNIKCVSASMTITYLTVWQLVNQNKINQRFKIYKKKFHYSKIEGGFTNNSTPSNFCGTIKQRLLPYMVKVLFHIDFGRQFWHCKFRNYALSFF